MIILTLITASIVLWGDDFEGDTGRWVADPRNPVSISYFSAKSLILHSKIDEDTVGYVHIEGNPQDVGRSSAWLYVEEIPGLSTASYLFLRLKGNGNLVRFRILFKSFGKTPYYYLQKTIRIPKRWKGIEIRLKDSQPIWSSNYPYALLDRINRVSTKYPDCFLFVENGESGSFSVDIDKIEVKTK